MKKLFLFGLAAFVVYFTRSHWMKYFHFESGGMVTPPVSDSIAPGMGVVQEGAEWTVGKNKFTRKFGSWFKWFESTTNPTWIEVDGTGSLLVPGRTFDKNWKEVKVLPGEGRGK